MAYGFEFRDAAGNVTLSNVSTGMRLVGILELDAGESGTYSVPDFDAGKGLFTMIPIYRVVDKDSDSFPYDYDQDLSVAAGTPGSVVITYDAIPALSWDNTGKTLTVDPPDPGDTESIPASSIGVLLPVKVFFIHYV